MDKRKSFDDIDREVTETVVRGNGDTSIEDITNDDD